MKNKRIVYIFIIIALALFLVGAAIIISRSKTTPASEIRKIAKNTQKYTKEERIAIMEMITNESLKYFKNEQGRNVSIREALEWLIQEEIIDSIDLDTNSGITDDYIVILRLDGNLDAILYAIEIGESATTGYTLNPPQYTKEEKVIATITSRGDNIKQITKQDGTIIYPGNKEKISFDEEFNENGIYHYDIEHIDGTISKKDIVIDTIDTIDPKDYSIDIQETVEGFVVTTEPEDNKDKYGYSSGIGKIEYYCKLLGEDSDYKKYTTNVIPATKPGTYEIYTIAYDKAGNYNYSTTITKDVHPEDVLPPLDFSVNVLDSVSDTELQIKAKTTDAPETLLNACSGIAYYKYYVYKDSELIAESDEVTGESWNVSGLTVGDVYTIYAVAFDNAGHSTTSESVSYEKKYVWEVYDVKTKVTYSLVTEDTTWTVSNSYWYYATTDNLTKWLTSPQATVSAGVNYRGGAITSGQYVIGSYATYMNDVVTSRIVYYIKSYAGGSYRYNVRKYENKEITTYSKGSTLLGTVTGQSPTDYPENGQVGEYWLVKK